MMTMGNKPGNISWDSPCSSTRIDNRDGNEYAFTMCKIGVQKTPYLYVHDERQLYRTKSQRIGLGMVYRCKERKCHARIVLTPDQRCIKYESSRSHNHDNDHELLFKKSTKINNYSNSITRMFHSGATSGDSGLSEPSSTSEWMSMNTDSPVKPQKKTKKMYKCKVCKDNFANNYTLKSHIATKHTRNLPFKCPHPNCEKGFPTKAQLAQHATKTHSEKRERCTICYVDFKDLAGHIARQHFRESGIEDSTGNSLENQEIISCKTCDLPFNSLQEIEEHAKKSHIF